MASENVCTWTADFDGNWETECGQAFYFENEGPKENNCRFCFYCGKTLQEQPYKAPYEDDDAD